METALKWKYDKEIKSLHKQLEELKTLESTVRNRICDSVGKLSLLSYNYINTLIDAHKTDTEWQSLITRRKMIRSKLEAWNTLLKVPIHLIDSDLIHQINSEYESYKAELIANTVRTLYDYDTVAQTWIMKV
jgi:hypothetical protein